MRILQAGAAAFCLIAATAACSGSGNDGGSGGYPIGRLRPYAQTADSTTCPSAAPASDTFMQTPTPGPGCTPPASLTQNSDSSADDSPSPSPWKRVKDLNYHVNGEEQFHPSDAATPQSQWRTIYTTYTPPPGAGVYQPMVSATNQPMPTPFATPTPASGIPAPTPYNSATP